MSRIEVKTEGAGHEQGPFAKAFFPKLIDYAGLFPPACLQPEEAIRAFLEMQASGNQWILSRFVTSAKVFLELSEELLAPFRSEQPLPLSLVVSQPREEVPQVLSRIESSDGRIALEMIECRINPGQGIINSFQENYEFLINSPSSRNLTAIFFELAPCEKWKDGEQSKEGEQWEEGMKELVRAIAVRNSSAELVCGLKLRCGGIEDALVPSPEKIATTLATVAAHSVPIKFTAGLHHPFRHPPRPEEGNLTQPVHGFFNVYFAALVSFLRNEAAEALIPIVSEMEQTSPVFEQDAVSWMGYRLTFAEIEEARRDSVLSFGSCSFQEPVADAVALGWIRDS